MGKREFAAKDAVALAAARRLVDAQADALRSREGQIAKFRDQVGMKAAEVTLAAARRRCLRRVALRRLLHAYAQSESASEKNCSGVP